MFKRDKKEQYLRFIPYTWQLIEMRSKNAMFKNLNFLNIDEEYFYAIRDKFANPILLKKEKIMK